jgi:UDP-4-amino-4,6-dideoxy-N-acetyl-beta-L-altrosamine N-acetyltransferase
MRESDQAIVLAWRKREDIAQFMLTKVTHDLSIQIEWFKKIQNSTTDEYWIIENNGKSVGVINLSEIDRINRHATMGLYLGEKIYSIEGGLIPIYFYNFIFTRDDLILHKLHGKVLAINLPMLKMHSFCNYRNVGTYKDHIFRDGKYIDVHIVELFREDWMRIDNRFKNHFRSFEKEYY